LGHRLGVGEPVGRGPGRGLVVPATVEVDLFGRRDETRGLGEWPVGLADADVGSATGGAPARGGLEPEPPDSAQTTPQTTAANSTPAPAIKRTPWRNRISSRRS
jgi:hypothetical protein